MQFKAGHCLTFVIVSLISMTALAVEKGKGEMRIEEPIVRIAGTSSDTQGEEATVLGVAIENGTIAIGLESIEGLRKVSVLLPDGKRVTPTAIVMFPDKGIAIVLADLKLRAARPVAVKIGGHVSVVQDDPLADMVVTRGLLSGESSVDIAASSPRHAGIVIDAEDQCLGVVVQPDAAPLRFLDVESIRGFLRQWRTSHAKGQ